MDPKRLEELLAAISTGRTTIDEALARLKHMPFTDIGMARPDMHRALRQGVPEVIFCQGKTPQQVAAIAGTMLEVHETVLATRCDAEQVAALEYNFSALKYHAEARVAVIGNSPITDSRKSGFKTCLVTAGTADICAAEECAVILEHMSFPLKRIYDVGVAGLHRVLAEVKEMQSASAIIVFAGMDGVLPSVVGGLVSCPLIAVPTSVGYGTTFGGVAPLLTMLNSCAQGITVVNIDNGFGAAMAVNRIFLSNSQGNEQVETQA